MPLVPSSYVTSRYGAIRYREDAGVRPVLKKTAATSASARRYVAKVLPYFLCVKTF
jgi:hypothetical protein